MFQQHCLLEVEKESTLLRWKNKNATVKAGNPTGGVMEKQRT
jgi:hypothetical protein